MFKYISNYSGAVVVDGTTYPSLQDVVEAFKTHRGTLTIKLNPQITPKTETPVTEATNVTTTTTADTIYRIRVRQYMTKPATPQFDFHNKWNNGTPMPLCVMVGKKLQETRGMVKMELWGEITETITQRCMKCGRPLTNPVSRYFGIGPECGGHNYVNPFDTEAELKAAVADMQTKLRDIKWTGWLIKSAIEEEVILRKE